MPIKSERHSRCDQSCGQALGAGVVVILIVCTLCGIVITWKANTPHLEVRMMESWSTSLSSHLHHSNPFMVIVCYVSASKLVSLTPAEFSNQIDPKKFPSEVH